MGGARSLGRDDIGRLSPGAKADIIVIALDGRGTLRFGPVRDPIKSLVDCGIGDDVETVIVDGKVCTEDGRIPGALFIARGNIESRVEATIPRDKKIIIYCARGNRSALAADTMQQMGYQDVASMSQGFGGWVDAGGEVEG